MQPVFIVSHRELGFVGHIIVLDRPTPSKGYQGAEKTVKNQPYKVFGKGPDPVLAYASAPIR